MIVNQKCILEQYLKKYNKIEDEAELRRKVACLSATVSLECTTAGSPHTLSTYQKNFRENEKRNLSQIYETGRIKIAEEHQIKRNLTQDAGLEEKRLMVQDSTQKKRKMTEEQSDD